MLDGNLITVFANALNRYENGQPDDLIRLLLLVQDARLARLILSEKGYDEKAADALTQMAHLAPARLGNGSTQ